MAQFSSPPQRRPRIHFSGIGGTAMVAGARLAIEAGWEVRGSDHPLYPPTSHMVQDLGIPVATGYAAENLDWGPDCVVIGNALSRGNPEVEAVLERKMRYVSLPEWMKDAVLRARTPVVICGTHGKTTTTALTAWLLDQAGAGPGFLIGGEPLCFPHPARLGPEGAPFVIEGDEYDTAFFDKRAKFFHYLPQIAIVTSIEFDHGDIYANIEEIERAFRWMLRQIPSSGWPITCADAPRPLALKDAAFSNVLTYGLSSEARFRGVPGPMREGFQQLTVFKDGAEWGRFETPLAGRHNLQNALAALAAGDLLGLAPERLAGGMRAFRGVRRRLEVFHEARGIVFVDDFAHHPTAIRETIAAARMRWPGRRLWALFEPRSNTTVTNLFQKEMQEAFSGADLLWMGTIHRIEKIPPEKRLDREAIARELERGGMTLARAASGVEEILASLQAQAREGDLVLILSNGAFGGIYEKIKTAFPAD